MRDETWKALERRMERDVLTLVGKGLALMVLRLLNRFDWRGAEVALGLVACCYGLGIAAETWGGSAYPGPGGLAFILGLAIQFAAYYGSWVLRRGFAVLSVGFWCYEIFRMPPQMDPRDLGIAVGLVLISVLVAIRASDREELRR